LSDNPNITPGDVALVEQLRKLLLAVLDVPADRLEHVVQLAHESGWFERNSPLEPFRHQGISRQTLRMLWHFRCNLESVMPREAHR
jgi:hypothetical protein